MITRLLLAATILATGGATLAAPPKAATPAAPATPQLCGGQMSGDGSKALVAFQAALNSKDAAQIAATNAAAQAKAKSPGDQCILGQLELQAAAPSNDVAGATKAIARIVASGVASPTMLSPSVLNIGKMQYNAKNYAGAMASFSQVAALLPNDPEPLVYQAMAKTRMNDWPGALALYNKAFALRAKGAVIKPEWMATAVGDAYNAKRPEALDLSRQWIASNPSPSNWHDALAMYLMSGQLDNAGTVDIYRLQRATKALTKSADYNNYAGVLLDNDQASEAKSVLDEGLAANLLDSTRYKQVIADAGAKAKSEKANLSTTSAAATSNPAARAAMKVGDRYFGMGDYAKAAAMFRAAMTKTGVDKNDANLKLGEALAMSGDTAGAKAAFQAVTGPKATSASYWLIWLGQRG